MKTEDWTAVRAILSVSFKDNMAGSVSWTLSKPDWIRWRRRFLDRSSVIWFESILSKVMREGRLGDSFPFEFFGGGFFAPSALVNSSKIVMMLSKQLFQHNTMDTILSNTNLKNNTFKRRDWSPNKHLLWCYLLSVITWEAHGWGNVSRSIPQLFQSLQGSVGASGWGKGLDSVYSIPTIFYGSHRN